MDTFDFLGQCRKHGAYLGGVRVVIATERNWVELNLDDDTYQDVGTLGPIIETLRDHLLQGAISLTTTSLNFESGQALLDMVAELKTTLKHGETKEAGPKT